MKNVFFLGLGRPLLNKLKLIKTIEPYFIWKIYYASSFKF